jgi:hypothetical protein
MKIEILQTKREGQVLAVTFTYEDGKVTGVAEPGHEIALKSIESDPVVVPPGKKISLKDDPKGWFMGLLEQYSGTYLRAEMVSEKQDVNFAQVLQA